MMKSSTHTWWWRMAALLALIGVLLTACGGSTNQQTPPTSAAPGGGAAETTAPATNATTSTGPGAATTPAGEATAAPGGAATSAPSGAATTAPAAGGATTGGGPKLNPDVSGTIDFWHFWGSPVRRNAIRRVIAICQQQLPNIKVNDTFKPFGDIWTANIAAVSAGSGMPDVIVEDRPQLPQRALDGIDEDLQERADRDGVGIGQFYDFAWKQTLSEDGHTYGIPFETDVTVMFWNKNAFKAAGLDPENPPKTWKDIDAIADKLDKKGPDGKYQQIAFFPLINRGVDIWGYTNSVNWISDDGKPQINSPQAVETVQWVKKWIDRYGGWQAIQDFRAQFSAPPNDPFMSGKVAMVVDIAGYSSQLNFYRPQVPTAADPSKKENLDWAVTDLPYNTKLGTWSGGFALSIPKGAKNQDAAWEFVKCATGKDGQASWARDTYAIPTNKAAATDPVLQADPNWQVFAKAMTYTTGGNYLKGYPNWIEQLNQNVEKVWNGQLQPKDALDQAQKAVEEKAGSG